MLKNLFSFLLLILLIMSCNPVEIPDAEPGVDGRGFVHVEGLEIRDPQNKPLTFKAVNLGGWLIWEGWIFGAGDDWITDGLVSETEVMKRIADKTSVAFAENFRSRIYEHWITEDDIREIKATGFNTVVLNFNHRVLDHNDNATPVNMLDFTYMDKMVDWCEQHGLYLMLEMHATPGGQSPYFVCDPDHIRLWDSEEHKQRTIDLWTAIAGRYANRKCIAGFDLMGEPGPWQAADLVALNSRIIKRIRSVNKHHMIILQGMEFTKQFDFYTRAMDINQIFSFHFYPWAINRDDWEGHIKKWSDEQKRLGVPFFCGEWGELNIADLDYLLSLLRSGKFDFAGDAFWTWKKAQYNDNFPLFAIQASADWKRWISGKDKTGQASYEALADEFITASAARNCILSEDIKAIIQRY